MNHSEHEDEDEPTELMLALRTYRAGVDRGRPPDRAAFLAQHPDIAEELADCLDGLDLLRAAVPGLTSEAAPSLPLPTEGTLGDFRLLREIGRGGMGVVYEAIQISLGRRVALKVLPFASALDPRQLQRFKNEATAAANLRHENIVPVYAIGCERGVHFYAMPFIEGQSLAALIAGLRAEREGLPGTSPAHATTVVALTTARSPTGKEYPDWVARLGRQAALALEYAHQSGIIHRDVKPGNLLLDPRGQLWVADFGLALVTGDSGVTVSGELLGTLRYASPEQAAGRRGLLDHRSDVYSLGATLYELLTLRLPFDGRERNELLRQIAQDDPPSLRVLNPAVPVELETVILKALRKEPAERYSSAQDFADDLGRFLAWTPVLARRPGIPERFRAWVRRHPSTAFGAVAILLLLTVGSLITAALLGAEQERTREAYTLERQRATEAEARFALARRAVDEMFRVSEEELADRLGTEPVRKRLLISALAYYQEFAAERRDDPAAQAELVETARRVEKILDDLAVLRTATRFYLLRQPTVLDELKLTPDRALKLKSLTDRVGREWMESFHDIGLSSPSERARRTIAQARANEFELAGILDADQQIRLRQIGLQADGTAAFHDPEVATALGLTAEQRDHIRRIEDDAAFGWMRGEPRPKSNGESPTERILAGLTGTQRERWRSLTGERVKGLLLPFGFPPKSDTKSP